MADENDTDEDGIGEDGIHEDGIAEDGIDEDGTDEDGTDEDGTDEDNNNEILLNRFDTAIAQFPKASEGHTAISSLYAAMLYEKYERWGRKEDLEEATWRAKESVAATLNDHPDWAGRLTNLGNMLESRYKRMGKVEDLEEAIKLAQDAVAATPNHHPDRAGCLINLGNKLWCRHKRTERIEDLEEAVQLARYAVAATPNHHPDRASWLSNLGNKLGYRYERMGRIKDLEEAVQLARDAVAATPNHHPDQAGWLNNLGHKLWRQYKRTGKIEDLEEVVQLARDAVAATPNNHPHQAGYLNNLGNMLRSQYERTERIEDLEEAIQSAQNAVAATPNGHADRASFLNNLGNTLQSQYARTGRIEDLEEAIQSTRDAVAATPSDHADRAGYLNNLGNILRSQYERTGKIEDLEEAIQSAQNAVAATFHDHPDRASYLNNLGIKLESRYERTGRTEDLEDAIQSARDAVAATANNHPDQVVFLDSLGNMLRSRYERSGRIEDLKEAVQSARDAATPDNHPNQASCLNNLGNILRIQYERTGRIEDLEEAIQVARDGVAATPNEHLNRAGYLNNLGNKLLARYQKGGRIEDLEEAIQLARDAVAATPNDHPGRAGHLNNLGIRLENRYKRTGKTEDHRSALHSFSMAWQARNGIPLHRLKAATAALQILKEQQSWSQASLLAVEAVELLPLVNNRTLSRRDQEYVVAQFSGLGAEACALLLMQQSDDNRVVEKALKVLELGRGSISNLLIDERSDISELRADFPDVAGAFENLQMQLNKTTEGEATGFKTSRSTIVQKLDQSINDIRHLPKYTRFLRPPSSKEIMEMAEEGPIIVINVTNIRSDAILIKKSSIQALPLPRFRASDIQQWFAKDLLSFNSSNCGEKNKEFTKFLRWLWDTCVDLVFQKLRLCASVGTNKPPRVWWIGTGLATSLPFHAAGDHSPSSTRNAVCMAISSYTPTLKALKYARERARKSFRFANGKPHLLTVAMPTTPGQNGLPGAAKEVTQIERLFQHSFTIQSFTQPTAEQVLNCLANHQIVHFACHGLSDVFNPSESCLIFQRPGDSASNPIADPLMVRQISQIPIGDARLAFLSACSTADNNAEAPLADEVIHLASGFQVAGFAHVIGSLWSSYDNISVMIAEEFYQQITTRSWCDILDEDMASALHKSVLKVRSQSWKWKTPLIWAQYVHFGA